MRLWREVMGDKLLGGVLCVVLLLSFAFQIAGASRAAAAMISPDPLSILCTSSLDGTHRPADAEHSKLCPCSELCAAGMHVQTASTPSDGSGIPIRFADRIEIAIDHSAASPFCPVERRYDARGPPRSST